MSEHAATTTARLDTARTQWIIDGEPFGPAGVVSIEPLPRVILRADAADPARLVELVLELDDATASPSPFALGAVAALVGAEAAGALAAKAGLVDGRPEIELSIDPATAEQRALLGRLALLDALRDETDPGEGSPWAAEAAELAGRADARLGLVTRARTEARAGAAALLDLAAATPAASWWGLARVAGAVAALIDPESPERARILRGHAWPMAPRDTASPDADAVDRELDALLGYDGHIASALVPGGPATHATGAGLGPDRVLELKFALDRVLVDSGHLQGGLFVVPGAAQASWNRGDLPVALTPAGATASFELAPGEMLVRAPLQPETPAEQIDGVWARAFLFADRSLLAIAPVRVDERAPGFGVARLAIAASHPLEHIEFELTSQPLSLPRAAGTITQRAALALGRRACTAERLERWSEAARWWKRCASYYRQVGDVDRRALALALAAHAAQRAGDDADAGRVRQLVTSLERDCTWALARLAGPPRQTPVFLAEALGRDRRDAT